MELKELLRRVKSGEMKIEEAAKTIDNYSYIDMEAAVMDNGRLSRCGFPEAVLGQHKSVEQLMRIVENYQKRSLPLLITRLTDEQISALKRAKSELRVNTIARTGTRGKGKTVSERYPGELVICCAGTSDLRIAEEARETSSFFGREPVIIKDVGVAGLHRLVSHCDILRKARVVIAVAGMEGALPGVVAGLVRAPVIAVPTSVGYGVSQDGIAALLGMLSSCSSGITVMNIDNGFGAACAAERILSLPTVITKSNRAAAPCSQKITHEQPF